jgi:PAS domain S-box-containing protein
MVISDARLDGSPILFANEAFARLTGYARDEIVGRNGRFLDGAETDRATVAEVARRLAAGEPVETEILNYRKDGTAFWNALAISPIRTGDGELIYFFASHGDVSEKRRAQSNLALAKAALEEEVARRTADLQAALDQKVALLHEVDHRVKNNLQVISSLILLKARRIADPAAQLVLHSLAERIAALSTVYRLLYPIGDASRFDLAEFLVDLTSDLRSLVPGGSVEVAVAADPVPVSAAKAAPLALLMNELIGNAFKHAYPDRRRGRLRVAIGQPDGHLRIVVEDDGVGLAGGELGGHGFGKTLVDMLIRQLRGELAFENAAPGTRAIVTMPLDAEEAQF